MRNRATNKQQTSHFTTTPATRSQSSVVRAVIVSIVRFLISVILRESNHSHQQANEIKRKQQHLGIAVFLVAVLIGRDATASASALANCCEEAARSPAAAAGFRLRPCPS